MNKVNESHKQTLSRKKFLQAGLAGTVLIVAGGKLMPLGQALAEARAKYALIIDLNKCTGCRACELACRQRNDLPGEMSYIRIYRKQKPDGSPYFLPVQCQHCENPPCASVCPTGATYHHESGTVLVNHKTCVGCRYCMVACPYDARRYDEEKGIAEKCWLCLDWVLGGGEPACVQACAPRARIFGRRDDPNSEVAQLIASGRAKPLHPEFGTQPGILFYIFPGE